MGRSVAVSVLFTDLVGSTELAARLGAVAAEQQRVAHFGTLRRVVTRFGGREVKNLGDGIMAVFPSVGASLDAAIGMQQAVARRNTRDGTALAIRVGVAVGDCVEEDGDYFGEPVVQAARLCALAADGQILATEVVQLLAPRGEHAVDPVGDLPLKGLPEPVATVSVRWSAQISETTSIPLPDRLLLPSATAFVGREEERSKLRDAYESASSDGCRVVLIGGEAGLGKTRLSSELAREAFEAGAVVLYGRCDQDLMVPYRPWVEMCEHVAAHATDEALEQAGHEELLEVARLVPGLRSRLRRDGSPAHAPAEPSAGDRYVLFRAVSGLVGVLAEERPLVLILDDLHWADPGTVQLFRHVVTSLTRSHLLVIGAYRETEIGPDHPLVGLAGALHREVPVERIELSGLPEHAVGALVRSAFDDGAACGQLARALRTETGGNPFFIVELLRHLVDTGAVERNTDGEWVVTSDVGDAELPLSVRDVISARLQRLGRDTHELLSAAAVLGRDFDVRVVSAVAERSRDEALALFEPALDSGLVVEVDATGERLSFTHALVHHSIYRELTGGRRALLHRRAAETIGAQAQDSDGRAGEVAHHLFAGLPEAEWEQAVPCAVEAGRQALAASAPGEAVRWFRRALDALERYPDRDPVRRGRVLVGLGEAEREAGAIEHREHLLAAAELAREHDDPELLVAAAIANHRGVAASETGAVDDERVDVLESALAVVGSEDRAERALVLAGLAGELIFSGQERRFDLAGEAVEVARRVGDERVLVIAVHRAATVLDLPRCFEQRHRWVDEAMRLTETLGDPVGRFLTLTVAARDDLTLGDSAAASAATEEAAVIAHELGRPVMIWHATFLRSTVALARGELAESERLAEQALHIGVDSGQLDAMQIYGAQLTQIRWHQGRTGEPLGVLVETVEQHPHMPVYAAALALLHVLNGERERGGEVLARLTAEGFPFPEDWNWAVSCGLSAQAAHLLGDRAAAEALHRMLEPYAHLVIGTGATCLPAVAHHLGILAATLGRREEAEQHLLGALERHERLGSPFYQALTQLELAQLLAESQPERARSFAVSARRLAERHGYDGLLRGLGPPDGP